MCECVCLSVCDHAPGKTLKLWRTDVLTDWLTDWMGCLINFSNNYYAFLWEGTQQGQIQIELFCNYRTHRTKKWKRINGCFGPPDHDHTTTIVSREVKSHLQIVNLCFYYSDCHDSISISIYFKNFKPWGPYKLFRQMREYRDSIWFSRKPLPNGFFFLLHPYRYLCSLNACCFFYNHSN